MNHQCTKEVRKTNRKRQIKNNFERKSKFYPFFPNFPEKSVLKSKVKSLEEKL